ncbi:MAG: TolC family protein [Candidatus Korobacteraceae bacterium]
MKYKSVSSLVRKARGAVLSCITFAAMSSVGFGQGPVKIALDDAIRLALEHNHNLLAARTTIQQSEAMEVTANLKPNPVFFADWEYLPFFTPSEWNTTYIHDSTEADAGLSYLFERGGKRARRYQAAKDVTAVTRSLVTDNERTLIFQVAALFINVQLAESTLELAREDLNSYQKTVDLGDMRYKKGAISEDDYLKIDLQLLQFQNDEAQAELATVQALSDLRNLLGYESVPVTYDVAGVFDYNPVQGKLEDFQAKALQTRPDYRAAQQGVTGANSQFLLAKANGKQDVTVQANYSHVNAINAASFYVSVPLAIHNRNQGEIARTQFAITQSQQQEQAANNQVLTDVRDAYEGLQTTDRILQLYRSGYLERAKKDRDISEYAYQRGAVSLLDFLDAERSYRATQLAYRQAIASGLLAEEQLRQAVGTRSLP